MTLALVLGAVVAVLAVLFVARPFLRDPVPAVDRLDEPDALERRRRELSEQRDQTLAALKELEFDHRTGKISDDDYRALVGPYRRRAAEALRALDAQPRISRAFAEVQPAAMVQVPEPYPPPDEGTPPVPAPVPEPSPAPVPEPYPPPDEGSPPAPPDIPEPSPPGAATESNQ